MLCHALCLLTRVSRLQHTVQWLGGWGVSGVVLATPMACDEVAVAASGILVQIQTTGPDGG